MHPTDLLHHAEIWFLQKTSHMHIILHPLLARQPKKPVPWGNLSYKASDFAFDDCYAKGFAVGCILQRGLQLVISSNITPRNQLPT